MHSYKKRYLKNGFKAYSIIFYVVFLTLLLNCRKSERIRIACLPVVSENKWMDLVIADRINSTLKRVKSESLLVYPLDWTWDTIALDSIDNQEYLIQYAERIGVDYVLLNLLESPDLEKFSLKYRLINPKNKECVLQDTATFSSRNLSIFIQNLTDRILLTLSIVDKNSSSQEPPGAEDLAGYGNGRYAQLTGNMDDAEKYFSRIQSNPIADKALISLRLEKAIQFQSNGKFVEDIYLKAFEDIIKNIQKDSAETDFYTLLGRLYVQRSWWNKAERILSQAIELDPENPEIYFYLSRLHDSRIKKLNQRNQEECLKKALSINPAMERAWIALGNLYYFKNKQRKAEAVYRKLLAINPNSLDGLMALGKIYILKNDVMNIIHTYKKVIDIAPTCAEAYYNLGVAYYNDTKVDEAKRFFERAVDLENHLDSHYFLGIIYQKEEKLDEAISHFRIRIRYRKGQDDFYAEEARKHLWNMLQTKGKSL